MLEMKETHHEEASECDFFNGSILFLIDYRLRSNGHLVLVNFTHFTFSL